MTKKSILCFIFSFLFFYGASAQEKKDSLCINLNLKFGKLPLELNKRYISESQDSLQIDLFKFYISNIEIQYSDKTILKRENDYNLVDIENPNSYTICIGEKSQREITKVTFNIGVDSLVSVSGALSGDLDPTKGMYWAWQSGYINMKIEGTSTSCKTRKNAFQFHIGGYLKPNYAMRKLVLETNHSNSNIEIVVDVAKIFSSISLSKSNSIMIPGKNAMEIADKSVSMFHIK